MLRMMRTLGLSAGLMLVASLAAPAATGMAAAPQGAGGCVDTTPLNAALARQGAKTPSITDPVVLGDLGSYRSAHDSAASRADRARAETQIVSARKLGLLTNSAFRPAANVSAFASREAAAQACAGVPASSSVAARLAAVAQGLTSSAYACTYPATCSPGFAYIQYLNHQNEGGSGTWCGPATVSMIAITEPGPSYVTQQGARDWITQHQGAPVEQNGTDAWAERDALNHFVSEPNLGWDFYAWVSVDYTPTSQQRSDYHSRIVIDIVDYGYAVGGNTWEVAGSQNPHLPGHPTGFDIFHYIEIGGYDENYGEDYFADSATGVPGWGPNVPPYSWYSEYNMVTLLGGRGYIW